jgi:hypothetical protein
LNCGLYHVSCGPRYAKHAAEYREGAHQEISIGKASLTVEHCGLLFGSLRSQLIGLSLTTIASAITFANVTLGRNMTSLRCSACSS